MVISDYSINNCTVDSPAVSCFDTLSEEEKEIVRKNQIDINYRKGEIICKQGSFASHIMYLREGLAKIYLEGKPKNLIIKIAPSNQLIGLPSLFDGNNTFLYSSMTYLDSKVSLIDINVFKQLLRRNANFASEVINILNENTVQTYSRFFCLTRKQLHGRLADIIICLSQRIFKAETFDLAISRSDLAELTGMSTESVIRIIKDFKDDKIIQVSGKNIKILDYDKLRKISEVG
jgi:CRP/FNR family transcriptional regulator